MPGELGPLRSAAALAWMTRGWGPPYAALGSTATASPHHEHVIISCGLARQGKQNTGTSSHPVICEDASRFYVGCLLLALEHLHCRLNTVHRVSLELGLGVFRCQIL